MRKIVGVTDLTKYGAQMTICETVAPDCEDREMIHATEIRLKFDSGIAQGISLSDPTLKQFEKMLREYKKLRKLNREE